KGKAQPRVFAKRRLSARARGYDHDWQKVRARFIRQNPICVECGRLAEHVDHIVPISQGGARLDERNLQSLCRSCHSKKTAREIKGPDGKFSKSSKHNGIPG